MNSCSWDSFATVWVAGCAMMASIAWTIAWTYVKTRKLTVGKTP